MRCWFRSDIAISRSFFFFTFCKKLHSYDDYIFVNGRKCQIFWYLVLSSTGNCSLLEHLGFTIASGMMYNSTTSDFQPFSDSCCRNETEFLETSTSIITSTETVTTESTITVPTVTTTTASSKSFYSLSTDW